MTMQFRPILSALRMHKAGTVLIALQIALTLAIVCNALFIIQMREKHLSRPTGIDESSLLVVRNQWVGKPGSDQIASLMAADLVTLRQLPGVADAYATNAWPLGSGGSVFGMGLTAEKQASLTETAIYYVDEHALATLGLKLVAGRNFRADEINQTTGDKLAPATVIVTRDLAEKMFPDGHALGKAVYISAKPSIIIGIVDRLQVVWADSFSASWAERSTLVPYQLLAPQDGYVIRAKPGQLDALMHAVPKALITANRMRVIDPDDGVQTFSQVRVDAYKGDRGMVMLMSVVCVLLLAITAAGIVGLTSFWVGQRRRQIGVRRALGATKRDIVDYFLTENLLIGSGGVVVGALLAEGLSLWLVMHFELSRMPLTYIGAGMVVLLLLGQGAVLAPALRASKVSPVEATRSV
jgi:putative ABC transport system permease protein